MLSFKTGLYVAAPFIALLITASCATRNPSERRIEKRPDLFERLTPREKELVAAGEIAEGMSRDAVYLAWGRPDMVRSGSRQGESSESWAYFDSVPMNTVSIGFGTGGYHSFYTDYGIHPRFGYGVGPGWSYSTGVDFVGHISRTVEFSNDRVIAWERRR